MINLRWSLFKDGRRGAWRVLKFVGRSRRDLEARPDCPDEEVELLERQPRLEEQALWPFNQGNFSCTVSVVAPITIYNDLWKSHITFKTFNSTDKKARGLFSQNSKAQKSHNSQSKLLLHHQYRTQESRTLHSTCPTCKQTQQLEAIIMAQQSVPTCLDVLVTSDVLRLS